MWPVPALKTFILYTCINIAWPCFSFHFTADENYDALKKSFLRKGRGRPSHPPEVHLTNRLLLQFQVLQNESNATRNVVSKSFHCLLFYLNLKLSSISVLFSKSLTILKKLKIDQTKVCVCPVCLCQCVCFPRKQFLGNYWSHQYFPL